ncbi:DNA-binding transcriptional MerR regulator [Paenibacillus phyllosphaerae]|uniref:DNA-binding transcriptional MerR regulator n=1 Tax=Paenibacillus phyllosphaerae TaxID=274593 RepID=A0A7W5B0Z1_9BACL|nr:MerR family transcriptional regulator [Paenibacillus phyllosphaerae]MBB3112440.1 DNA-binding transcriptional MerR regulator [Paenibacillus phyllosphaerae]
MAFSIKEASERLGCPAPTIRYYEKEGLLPYIQRDKHGNRQFEQEHLDWIRLMTCFRATGMKMSVLKRMVNLALDGDSTIPQRKAILNQYKEELFVRQRELAEALDAVNNKLAIYEDIEKGRVVSESAMLAQMEVQQQSIKR